MKDKTTLLREILCPPAAELRIETQDVVGHEEVQNQCSLRRPTPVP